MIKLEKVSIDFSGKSVLNNLNISFEDKGLYALIGESGSGKTTLLNIISMQLLPYEGSIYYNNRNLLQEDKNYIQEYKYNVIAYVKHNLNLIEHLSVKDNISFFKKINLLKLDKILKLLKINHLLNQVVNTLSGGERQRVSLARALYNDNKIILADEITSNLDSDNAIIIMDILKEISKDKLVIISTHNKELANLYTDKIIDLQHKKNYFFSKVNSIENANKNKLTKPKLSYLQSLKLFLSTLFLEKNILFKKIIIKLFFLFLISFLILFSFTDKKYLEFTNIKNSGITNLDFVDDEILWKEIDDNFSNDNLNINYRLNLSEFSTEDNFYRTKIEGISFIESIDSYKIISGNMIKDSYEVIISDYLATSFIKNDFFEKNLLSFKDIIGQNILIHESILHNFKIVGIYETNYKNIENKEDELGSNFIDIMKNKLSFLITDKSYFTLFVDSITNYDVEGIINGKNLFGSITSTYNKSDVLYEIDIDNGFYISLYLISIILDTDKEMIKDNPKVYFDSLSGLIAIKLENKVLKVPVKGIIDDTEYYDGITRNLFFSDNINIINYKIKNNISLDNYNLFLNIKKSGYDFELEIDFLENYNNIITAIKIITYILVVILIFIFFLFLLNDFFSYFKINNNLFSVLYDEGIPKSQIKKVFIVKSSINLIIMSIIAFLTILLFLNFNYFIYKDSIKLTYLMINKLNIIILLFIFALVILITYYVNKYKFYKCLKYN